MSKQYFFPGEFKKDFPKVLIKPELWWLKKLWDEDKEYATIPIQELCHTTYKDNAEKIKRSDEDYYSFQPTMKTTAGFPGHLSWWSIDVQHWYQTDQGKKLRAAVRELERENIYAPHTIQATPTSRYGNYRFSISFEDIVTSYVSSRRKHCRSKNVYLLKAGTLVCNYEICYVIMVCMEDDRNEIDELNKMPILHIINNGEDDNRCFYYT